MFKIILDFRLYLNPCRNALPVNPINNKLINALEAHSKSSSSQAPTFWSFFRGSTLDFTLIFALGSTSTVVRYTNEHLQKAT